MNTFTFTDDEVEWLIEAIKTSDIDGSEGTKHLDSCLDKLERKPSYIVGECGGPELKFNTPEIMIHKNNRICLCDVHSGTFGEPTRCIKCSGRLPPKEK